MRKLKLGALALPAVFYAICALGATSAFAVDSEVVFCKKLQALCEPTAIWPAGTEFKLLSENQQLLGNPEMKCEHAESSGKTLQSMAEFLEADMEPVSFSGCNVCKAVDPEIFPRRQTFWMEGAVLYTHFEIEMDLLGCGTSNLSCKYSGELPKILVENTESGVPVMTVSKAILKFVSGTGGESYCGKTNTWDGSWTITTPKGPIWFSLYQL